MRTLFVYPNASRFPTIPLGLASVMAILAREGRSHQLFDATFINDNSLLHSFLAEIGSYRPDVIAIHCTSCDWPLVEIFLKGLGKNYRKQDYAIVIGGPHPTVVPEEVISHPLVDIIAVGEGEQTAKDLWDKLEKGCDFTNTAGCWIRVGQKVCRNPLQGLIPDLDSLPYPSWESFDARHTYLHSSAGSACRSRRQISMEASRGCQYSCTFCINSYMHHIYRGLGTFRREKSADRIIGEAQYLRDKLGATIIQFADENFTTSRNQLRELSIRFPKEVGLPACILMSANFLDEEVVRLLADMGVSHITIGVEVGDEKYRMETLRKPVTNEQIVRAFKLAKAFGIATKACNMIGLPLETRAMANKTLELNNLVQPDVSAVYTFFPFPGTSLHSYVLSHKLVQEYRYLPDTYHDSILKLTDLTQDDLLGYRAMFPNVTTDRGPFGRRNMGILSESI